MLSRLPIEIVAADVSSLSAGLYMNRDRLLIPKVEELNGPDHFIDLLNNNKIDAVMIGSEFELCYFSEHRFNIEEAAGAKIIVAPKELVAIANDKLETANYFKMKGLPSALSFASVSLDDAIVTAQQIGYPLILKTRNGTSSRGVHLIKSQAELEMRYHSIKNPMLQESLGIPSADLSCEYTCSIFKDKFNQLFGPFVARRTLKNGSSWAIEVLQDEGIARLMREIGEKIDFLGSLNVQLFKTTSGSIPFEINARFSGTTFVRAHFGFNEPEMALKSFLFNEPIGEPKITTGCVLRYSDELFLDGANAKNLFVADIGTLGGWRNCASC